MRLKYGNEVKIDLAARFVRGDEVEVRLMSGEGEQS